MEEAAATQRDQSTDTESVIIQPDLDPPAMCPDEPDCREPKTNLNQGEIFKALEIIERDSLAIAGSFTSLFASLRFALSEVSFDSSNFLFGSWEKEMKYLFFFFCDNCRLRVHLLIICNVLVMLLLVFKNLVKIIRYLRIWLLLILIVNIFYFL